MLCFRRILPILLFALLSGSMTAQRSVFKAELSAVEEGLRFDVNIAPVSSRVVEAAASAGYSYTGKRPDLNMPPSLVFSLDGSRAFLPVPGSDKVLVFSPRTGEFEAALAVPKNPLQAALSPDGRYVFVACIEVMRNLPESAQKFEGDYVGFLVRIDVDTLQTTVLEFKRVFFSVVNNLVFSPDGSTVFLASAGTDELLRVDVELMQEAGPRLKFIPGACPTQVLVIPQRNMLAVCLVGSTALYQVDYPDAVVLVDFARFQEVKRLEPATGPGQEDPVVHEFTATTRMAVSSDGRYLGIPDQMYSSNSAYPYLATDRFWVFDLETGEQKGYLVAGLAMGVYWTPDDRFLVISSLNLSFVDPVTDEITDITPLQSDFRPGTIPAFSPDGRWLYLAAPLNDSIVVYDLVTGEVPRLIDVGGQVELSEGSSLPSAPLVLALTPDEEFLIVLNYNANALEWVTWTSHFFIQGAVDNEEFFTGITLANPSEEDASVIMTGFTRSGVLLSDDPGTEDVVEYINPREWVIPARGQLAQTSPEWIESSEAKTGNLWFDVDTDQPELRGFFLIGDRALRRMDGVVAARKTSQRWVLPEVHLTDGMATELVILNPNRQSTSYSVTLFDEEGDVVASVSNQLASRTFFVGMVRDIDASDGLTGGLFPESVFKDFTDGYLQVSCPTGVVVYARYFDAEKLAVLNATPVSDLDEKPTRFVVSQVVGAENAVSTLRLVNSYPKPIAGEDEEEPELDPEMTIHVSLKLRDDQGTLMAEPVELELVQGQAKRADVLELFDLVDTGELVSGWLEIQADRGGLVGDVELVLEGGRAMTTLALASVASTELFFSHVAQGAGISTGVALVNAGDEASATRLEIYAADGTVTGLGKTNSPRPVTVPSAA
ncbi:MAG TPA: hypothetical protein P5057_08340 [Acidobacteriota bacterium]|nr:hypothetical protein [Acidobacteriota bacterium]